MAYTDTLTLAHTSKLKRMLAPYKKACCGGVVQILVIAVLMRLVLKRKFSLYQWEALVLLMAGITVNQLNNCG